MKYRVFVDGQEGTTGLRIHEYLAKRDDVEVLSIAQEKRKDAAERARLLNAADVAFLCLPDAAAREAVSLVTNPKTCIIDASTAHRTAAGWVFGLPELAPDQRARLRESKRVANPGCHSTGFILLMRPLVDAGLAPTSALVTATSITGYSGGGRKMIERYSEGDDPKLAAPMPYGLTLAHKHVPEMRAHSGLEVNPVFMPIVGDFYKGLAVSVPLHLRALGAGVSPERIHAVLTERYRNEAFIQVRPLRDPDALESTYFDVQACNDTNQVDLFVFANDSQVVLIARLDNLGKGASGAAVQTMNVHLGLDEAYGL